MDTQVDEIVSGIPMHQLADRLGVDPSTAESAVRQALPALLGGMQANAQDPAGAASLAEAVDQHSPGLVDGGVDLADVDTADGEKIVSHVFGSRTSDVAQTLGGLGGLGGIFGGGGGGQGGQAGGGNELIQKLLPILAPIVLSYLSQRLRGGGGQTPQGAGGGIGDLLGSILGGGQTSGQSERQDSGSSSSGSILDMLGNLLGGGRR